MKPYLSALLSAFLLSGCAAVLTKQPFGTAHELAENDRAQLQGDWYASAADPAKRMRLTVAVNKPGATLSVVAEGKTTDYDALFREVDTGVQGSPPNIVFFRPRGSDKLWRFAWIGGAANAGKARDAVLLIFFPDDAAFESLGLSERQELRPEAYDPFAGKSLILTGDPEKILAALKGRDLRTFMHATTPFAFLRSDPAKPGADATKAGK